MKTGLVVAALVLWVLGYVATRRTWGRGRDWYDPLGWLGTVVLAFILFAALIDVIQLD